MDWSIVVASLCVLCLITIMGIFYHVSKERLTGNYYIKRYIGFHNEQIIVEYKLWGERYTRVAKQEDLNLLKKKLKIEHF